MFGRKKASVEMEKWQERFVRNKNAYERERRRMDRREKLYQGTKEIRGAAGAEAVKPAAHVRNLVAELIESQVSSSIPQPKVTARRPEDEAKAKLIEDMLRNELDRMPFEYLNDQQERTVPIQGGALLLVEWDTTQSTHSTLGELAVSELHPKKVTPQDGVYSDIEDMDYLFLEIPQTKRYIKQRYGVDVGDESESAPEAKGAGEEQSTAEDLVTQIVAYYRNKAGGIGLFSWVNDTVLEDLEDYQARKVYVCKKCGQKGDGQTCRFCASERFEQRNEAYEELDEDITRTDGSVIPALSPVLDETGMPRIEAVTDAAGVPAMRPLSDAFGQPLMDAAGMPVMEPVQEPVMQPTRLPYYKPDVYPVVLRKNVSSFGQFLGDSDVDKIEDQQESTKKVETKLIEKLFKGGSILTAPQDVPMRFTDEELRIIRVGDPSKAQMFGVYNLQPDVSGDFNLLNQMYEEARQTIGITDSFQGRRDTTATSGVAKEFAARQSAGRLESKRAMKDAAYSRLFEVMFKFMLAYSDEPRTIVSTDNQGHSKYETFYRYDFLEQDEAGEWFWNDRFLFSTDASATLENNREAMWQEARMNFQQGCYGDPGSLDTLVAFWSRMEKLHYPGASDMKTYFEEKAAQQAQAAMMQGMMGAEPVPQDQGSGQTPQARAFSAENAG